MTIVNIYFTLGLGSQKMTFSVDSPIKAKEIAHAKVETMNGYTTKILGYDSICRVEKVIYIYPSGKQFVERF